MTQFQGIGSGHIEPKVIGWLWGFLWGAGTGCIVTLICILFFMRSAGAHDLPTDWIGQERRTNADKQLCCGEGDCHSFTVDQVKVMPDGYHFPDGEVIPFNKVAPSIDHFYWLCTWGGETKCVFAPLGAS